MNLPIDAKPTTLTSVFAAASQRSDNWRQLNALARAWASTSEEAAAAELKAECARQLEELRRLEHCWAYPGPRLLDSLSSAIERSDADAFARILQKVSGALLSGDFRRNEHVWDPDMVSEGRTLDTLPPDIASGGLAKPYFEVLMVTPVATVGMGARPR